MLVSFRPFFLTICLQLHVYFFKNLNALVTQLKFCYAGPFHCCSLREYDQWNWYEARRYSYSL